MNQQRMNQESKKAGSKREPRAASSSSISPSPPSDGGEGWGEEERFYWFPLSSVLSPLVPRGERMENLMQPWPQQARTRRRFEIIPCDPTFATAATGASPTVALRARRAAVSADQPQQARTRRRFEIIPCDLTFPSAATGASPTVALRRPASEWRSMGAGRSHWDRCRRVRSSGNN